MHIDKKGLLIIISVLATLVVSFLFQSESSIELEQRLNWLSSIQIGTVIKVALYVLVPILLFRFVFARITKARKSRAEKRGREMEDKFWAAFEPPTADEVQQHSARKGEEQELDEWLDWYNTLPPDERKRALRERKCSGGRTV